MPGLDDAAQGLSLRPVTSKSVLIAEPETIIPGTSPNSGLADGEYYPVRVSTSPNQYRTNASRRLSSRSVRAVAPSQSLHSISSISSLDSSATGQLPTPGSENRQARFHHHHFQNFNHANHILTQVAEWLQQEKAKRAVQNVRPHHGHAKLSHAFDATKPLTNQPRSGDSKPHGSYPARAPSDASDSGFALEKLEQILSESTTFSGDGQLTPTEDKAGSYFPRQKSIRRGSKLLRKSSTVASSDNENQDNDILVPSAEVVLDNTKTLGYSGGAASSELDVSIPRKSTAKEKEAWVRFKSEIVRLTHTLRIGGWRRISLDRGEGIDVERLSGALTNAVYVVSPPKNLPQTPAIAQDGVAPMMPRRPPPKLLLRIYGPQVDHLIDRESELQILRRLARKKIGPRLLGTFTNGRFEQFFHARTLTAKDLRVPETSRQIAKRMRELHDGIDLLEVEREEGASVWRNWDKWVDRCEDVITWLDSQILNSNQSALKSRAEGWKKRGLVCGVEWSFFRQTVDQYRKWLYEKYGGTRAIRQRLVFAHNDTQYGNLLRLEPSGESPLLLPANEHKQLVVIDFEYASANAPGLEFANHFTEWCYNYHDSAKSYALNARNYPTPEEQYRFLKTYVQHRPPAQSHSTFSSPVMSSTPGPTNSISSFMLDSRAPPTSYVEEESRREQTVEKDIEQLKHETRMWRVANSAQWVAWGIVQAKVPGMDEALEARNNDMPTPNSHDKINQGPPAHAHLVSDPLSLEMAGPDQGAHDKRPEGREALPDDNRDEDEEEQEFDYLAYAQERAMFFWGDVLQLGLVKREDLPENLLQKVKIVEY